jgi:hypothetical protein
MNKRIHQVSSKARSYITVCGIFRKLACNFLITVGSGTVVVMISHSLVFPVHVISADSPQHFCIKGSKYRTELARRCLAKAKKLTINFCYCSKHKGMCTLAYINNLINSLLSVNSLELHKPVLLL